MDKGFVRIAITPEYTYPSEAAEIEHILALGTVDFVHIRKPGLGIAETKRLLSRIRPELRQRLTLHDFFGLAAEYGIGGVHLNARNPIPPADWRGRLSVSCHSYEETLAHKEADYVTLSPVFPSISKPGYGIEKTVSLPPEFSKFQHCPPVIALGGVTPESFSALIEKGYDGAAMLGAAWRRNFEEARFRLQFITHPRTVEEAVRQASDALAGGCRWIQLRWKESSDTEYLEAAKEIAPFCMEHDAVFLLNDRVHLVDAAQADGVHLGKNDLPVAQAREMIGPRRIIGRTANTLRDVMEGIQSGADYIGLGPFRFTRTKRNLSPVLGLNGYEKIVSSLAARRRMIPIVGIGGIGIDDVLPLLHTGIQGVAVSGAIISAPDAVAATRDFCKTIDSDL